jgi:hypothetical protein
LFLLNKDIYNQYKLLKFENYESQLASIVSTLLPTASFFIFLAINWLVMLVIIEKRRFGQLYVGKKMSKS